MRTHQVLVRLSEAEHAALDREAARCEETPAGYLRQLLRTRVGLGYAGDEAPTEADAEALWAVLGEPRHDSDD